MMSEGRREWAERIADQFGVTDAAAIDAIEEGVQRGLSLATRPSRDEQAVGEGLAEGELIYGIKGTLERLIRDHNRYDTLAIAKEIAALRAAKPADEGLRDGEEMSEVAAMRYIEQLREDEGDSVTICCDNPEAESSDQRLAIDCNGAWTNWQDRRFYGESVLQCLAKAVTARIDAALSETVK